MSFITVGKKFPEFKKKSVVSIEKGKEYKFISNEDLKGKWSVLFSYPKDFSTVCPTELITFNEHYAAFEAREALLFGASTDTENVHLAWRHHNDDLRDLQYPLIADTSKSLAEELGILTETDKIAYRATYIIDPEGTVRWLSINEIGIGRNVEEVLRVLDALQTGEFTGCNWKPGLKTVTQKLAEQKA